MCERACVCERACASAQDSAVTAPFWRLSRPQVSPLADVAPIVSEWITVRAAEPSTVLLDLPARSKPITAGPCRCARFTRVTSGIHAPIAAIGRPAYYHPAVGQPRSTTGYCQVPPSCLPVGYVQASHSFSESDCSTRSQTLSPPSSAGTLRARQQSQEARFVRASRCAMSPRRTRGR